MLKVKISHKSLSFFQKNVLVMFKGTVISQIFGFFSAILLAKMYGSEAFGVLGVYFSISTIFTIINTLQLDRVIVLSKHRHEQINLMNTLFVVVVLMASFLVAFYCLLELILDIGLINICLFFLAVLASILYSYIRIHESFLTANKTFKPISNAKIFTAILNFIFQFILYYKFKVYGLVYGSILSIFIICIYYFVDNKTYIKPINIKSFWMSAIHNNTIIKYLLPSTLINGLANNLMPVLILSFFSLKISGVYFFSVKVLATPLNLIANSISEVYFEKSSSMLTNNTGNELYKFTKNIVKTNLLIMFVFIITVNSLGIYLLEILLTENWENLSLYLLILSFLILARSTFNPISNIITVLNKNHIGLVFNMYLLAVNLIAIYVGYLNNNFIHTLIILSLLGGIGYLVLLLFFLRILKNESWEK